MSGRRHTASVSDAIKQLNKTLTAWPWRLGQVILVSCYVMFFVRMSVTSFLFMLYALETSRVRFSVGVLVYVVVMYF